MRKTVFTLQELSSLGKRNTWIIINPTTEVCKEGFGGHGGESDSFSQLKVSCGRYLNQFLEEQWEFTRWIAGKTIPDKRNSMNEEYSESGAAAT